MVTPNKQKINAARAATGNVIVLSAEGKILFFTADRESAVNRFLNAAASFEVYASCMLGSLNRYHVPPAGKVVNHVS